MVNTRVVLLAREGEARKRFEDAMKEYDVQVDAVSSLQELHSVLTANPYNGVLIDLLVKLKAKEHEKTMLTDIIDTFPVLLLNYEKVTGEVRAFYFSQHKGATSIREFIEKECRLFWARVARSNPRKKVHLNVLIAGDDSQDGPLEKSFTVDISSGGCFVFSTRSRQVHTELFLIFNELNDRTPIGCEVCWKRNWGDARQVPGIGLRFKRIKENQLEEILALL